MSDGHASSAPVGIVVPGGFGRGFSVRSGQFISIIDLHGQQAGDFVAVNRGDHDEVLSPAHTRRHLRSLFFKVGDTLMSSRGRPMFEVIRDDVDGAHDATVPACDPTRYSVEFGVCGHRNCLENLHEGMSGTGIGILGIPEPFNFFQNGPVTAEGRMRLSDPKSKPGDALVLRALVDVECALSPCPQDIIPGNGLSVTDMRVLVTDAPPALKG